MIDTNRSAKACSAAFFVSYTTAPPKLIIKTIVSFSTLSLSGAAAVEGEPVGDTGAPPVSDDPPPDKFAEATPAKVAAAAKRPADLKAVAALPT